MKPNYYLLLTGALMLLFSSYSFSQTESEPNNTTATANLLAEGASVAGDIGPGDANDYFKGVPNDDGTVTMTVQYTNTSGDAGADLLIYMYNKAGTQIGSQSLTNVGLPGTGTGTVTVHCRLADTIYYRVNSVYAFDYSLSFNTVSTGVNDAEPNNAFGEATFFASGNTVSGRVGYLSVSRDVDDYYFTVLPDDGTLKVYLDYENTSGASSVDLTHYVYSKSGSQIGSSSLINRPVGLVSSDTITIHCRKADTVYFRVNANECISYDLTYEVIPSGSPDAEPNDGFNEATFFTQGTTMNGRVGYISVARDINDYYFTALPDDGTLKVYLTYTNTTGSSSVDLFYAAYNEAGAQIGARNLNNLTTGISTTDTLTIHCRKADTVFFRVNANECLSYSLSYEVISSGQADEEPNNNFAEAIFFPSDSTVNGRVGYRSVALDANDYYYSVLPDDGTLLVFLDYINTSGGSDVDVFHAVYNKAHSQITSSSLTNRPAGLVSRDTIIIHCRKADTVFFLVNANECISYSLSYEVIPSGEADVEPNDNITEATFFPSDSTVNGRVGYRSVAMDANDYYFSVLPEDGTLKVFLDYVNTSGGSSVDVFYAVYNKAHSQIGNRSLPNRPVDIATTDTLILRCRKADTVFFHVNANECISYSLSYEMVDTEISDQEPNNSLPEAVLIDLEDVTKGNIAHSSVVNDGNDYFKFYNSGYSNIRWNFSYNNISGSSGADLFLYAYNSNGSQRASTSLTNRPVGQGMDTSIIFDCVALDTFYVRVNASSGCFNYSFDFDLENGTFYKDADSDNYGDPDSSVYSCTGPPPGYIATAGDCDDDNSAVNPAATEVCDGVDNNCNGQIDEGIYTTSTANAAICEGDSILIGGMYRLTAGTYIDTTIIVDGCDSISTVTLTVNQNKDSTLMAMAICEGDSILIFGEYRNMAGVYSDTLQTGAGCDSIIYKELIINLIDTTQLTTTTTNPSMAGVFDTTYTNQYGCDSVVITTVTYTGTPCTNDSITINTVTCDNSQAGTTVIVYTKSDGCDSVVTTTTVYDPGSTTVLAAMAICDGDSLLVFGQYQSLAGTYYDTLQNVNGCDSILEKELIVNPIYFNSLPGMSICQGDSVEIFGVWQNTGGTYYDTLQTGEGCDSIVSKQLTVDSEINTSSSITICDGESAMIFGTMQSVAGTYADTSISSSGCDSIHTITLIVFPAATGSATVSICEGDSIFFSGAYQTTAGVYYDTLTAASSCDSVVVISLTIKPNTTVSVSDSICPGDSVFVGGAYQTTAGTYTNVFTAANGCDSIINTTVSVRDSADCPGDTATSGPLTIVSDGGWSKSTVVSPTSLSGMWSGVNGSLPAVGTFTDPAIVGQPYPWAHVYPVPGTDPIKTGHSITYFRRTFNLSSNNNLEARFQMTVDDQAEIYVNGNLVARLAGFGKTNYKAPQHDALFYGSGLADNGYLGGDAYDYTTSMDLSFVFQTGANDVIVVIRNLGKTSDKGGFSFRMHLNQGGAPIVPKSAFVAVQEGIGFMVYPNPTNALITVSLLKPMDNSEVRLYDFSGKLLERKSLSSQLQMDLSQYSQGVYLIKVTSGNKTYTQKVIRE